MKKNIFAMLLAVMMAFTPVSSLCAEEVILEEETGANQEIEAQSEGTDSRENTLIPEDGVQVLLEPSEDHPEGFNDNEDVQEGESILPGYTDSMASSIDSSLILSVEEVEDELGEGEDYTE